MKISVIVPVYNVDKYLSQCLDSILNQTHRNIEIILVNDGSTDLSESICKSYALSDHRIKFSSQENRGASSARNKGIDMASGEYIVFVDGDDTAHPRLVSTLLKGASASSQPMVSICSIGLKEEVYDQNPSSLNNESFEYISGQEAVERLLHQKIKNGPVGKMFRREAFNRIRFPEEMKVGEDLLMNLDVFTTSSVVAVSNIKLYAFSPREGSASRSNNTISRVKLIKKLTTTAKQYHDNSTLKKAFECRVFAESITALSTLMTHEKDHHKSEHYRPLINTANKLKRSTLLNKHTILRLKAYALASYISPTIPHYYVRAKRVLRLALQQ